MNDIVDPDLKLLEEIYEALDGAEPERALSLATAALAGGEANDPVLRFLSGIAQLELDRPAAAVRDLRGAVELDPDDAEIRANLALALFLSCDFPADAEQARRAVEVAPDLPDAHQVLALNLERLDRFDEADEHFKKAARIDPDAFPAPRRLTDEEFETQVALAGDRLPEKFSKILDEVAVSVEPLPTEAILLDQLPTLDPELLGLFVGTPISERSSFNSGDLPARILLFKRNLERVFPDPQQLIDEIVRTLHHELGHYLGLDEDELRAIDLD